MRKQTKLVAVLSASALLALGASMTSFAATGWTEENGTWVYYDNDGYQVTDTWKKSGNYWFWLNSDGEMATNTLIEDDGDYYYVDGNGAMVTNTWIQLENEDADEDDSEYAWYYFQSNGKAYTASEGDTVSFKTINGKKYTFDEDGKMMWGWIDIQGDRVTDENEWANGLYYCGTADDGAQVTGWAKLHVLDEDVAIRFADREDEEEQDYWFYFNTNGKKVYADENNKNDGAYVTKTINGQKYAFDEAGVMRFEWTDGFATTVEDSTTTASNWQYYNDREAGNRAKGWFEEVPAEALDSSAYDDASSKWFYSKNDGTLYANVIKTINGKKYGFNDKGEMLTGLNVVKELGDGKIEVVLKIDDEADLNNKIDVNSRAIELADNEAVYYFGDSSDGSMKLSSQNIEIDGEVYSFYFVKSGENKGRGFGTTTVGENYTLSGKDGLVAKNSNVYDDKAVYANGLKVTADSDIRYQAVDVTTGKTYTRSQLVDTVHRNAAVVGETVEINDDQVDPNNLVLINASGSIMKNKSSVKDGDEYYYSTNKYGVITAIGSEKAGLDKDDEDFTTANRYWNNVQD